MITIAKTKRAVPHNDADAAGFNRGYRWTLDLGEEGVMESYAPTRGEAETQASEHAEARNLFDVEVRDA